MEQTEKKTRIPWVKGNTLNLAVPLQLVTYDEGQKTTTDYFPPEGSEIHVRITDTFGGKEYPYTLTDNVVSFKDDGTLKCGCYGVEITVAEPQTEMVNGQNRRTFKQTIEIYNSLDELGDLPDGEIILDAAFFIQGQKGDKGDPFVYEDFTPEQIENLKKPAKDAAAEVAVLEVQIEAAEVLRVEAEQGRADAEALRVQAEQGRVQAEEAREQQASSDHSRAGDDHTLASADHQTASGDHTQAGNDHTASVTATGNANDAAALANQKAGLAAEKAALADQKATEAANVNASLSGTNITVTDRNGNSVTQNIKGEPGSDAEVTTENIVNALGYTPADKAVSDDLVERVSNLEVTQAQLDQYFPPSV